MCSIKKVTSLAEHFSIAADLVMTSSVSCWVSAVCCVAAARAAAASRECLVVRNLYSVTARLAMVSALLLRDDDEEDDVDEISLAIFMMRCWSVTK